MLHYTRIYGISEQDISTVAEALISSTWVLCNGYLIHQDNVRLLILNDALSEDSVQEYVVLRVLSQEGNRFHCDEVESLTVSWYKQVTDLCADLMRCVASDITYGQVFVRAEPFEAHTCWRCA